jgi:glycosyltransferase involved in cell wall biosynthesis
MKNKNLVIHLWFPDIFGFKGGIQVYSSFLLNSLQILYPYNQYEVFLKHDTHALLSFLKHTNFHFAGTFPLALRTPAFAAQIFGFGLWQRPNLVISTHINFTPAAYWLKRLTGIPYWIVAHGTEVWNIQRPALQKALYHADRILAVSSYTRDRILKAHHLNPENVSLLPNTFDEHRFHIASKPQKLLERYGLTANQPLILTVGRLDSRDRYKGYDQILQALPNIRSSIPNIHYIIVGKGDDRPRVEQLIHQLQLQDCVTLAGFIPDRELSDHYNLCDVFAMPSKGEGFGIVYLEALACGKPVLGGNQDGAIDALRQGELGALVDPDDVDAIAQTIVQILQGTYPNSLIYQPELLRQKVIEYFSFDSFKKTLGDLIKNSEILEAYPNS